MDELKYTIGIRILLDVWNPGQNPYGLATRNLPCLINPYRLIHSSRTHYFGRGYVDKTGTGTEDIVTLCKGKRLKDPEYY